MSRQRSGARISALTPQMKSVLQFVCNALFLNQVMKGWLKVKAPPGNGKDIVKNMCNKNKAASG